MAQDKYLFGHAGIQFVEALDHVTPVQHGRAVLSHLVQHKVPEQLQQVPIPCIPTSYAQSPSHHHPRQHYIGVSSAMHSTRS